LLLENSKGNISADIAVDFYFFRNMKLKSCKYMGSFIVEALLNSETCFENGKCGKNTELFSPSEK